MGSSNSKLPSYEEVLLEKSRQKHIQLMQGTYTRPPNHTNPPHPFLYSNGEMEDTRTEKEVQRWIREVLSNSDRAKGSSAKWTKEYIEEMVEMWEGSGKDFETLFNFGGTHEKLHNVFHKRPFAVFYLVDEYNRMRAETRSYIFEDKKKAQRVLIAAIMGLINAVGLVWLTLAVSVLKPNYSYWQWVWIGVGFTIFTVIQFCVSLWAEKPEAWELILQSINRRRWWNAYHIIPTKMKQTDVEMGPLKLRLGMKLPPFPLYENLMDVEGRAAAIQAFIDGVMSAIPEEKTNYLLKRELERGFDEFRLSESTGKKTHEQNYDDLKRFCRAKMQKIRGPEDYTK